jgi:hypothetical protein
MRTLASFDQCMRKNVTFKKVYRNYLLPMFAISWPSDITAHQIFLLAMYKFLSKSISILCSSSIQKGLNVTSISLSLGY